MKKALLVISFGTSYHDTCTKNIVACEEQLGRTFADRDRFRAFTSGMIIRKLKNRDNLEIDSRRRRYFAWQNSVIRMWRCNRCM